MDVLKGLSPAQIAFAVSDARKAAMQHFSLFGSGPYFVVDNIKLKFAKYRGQQTDWDHTGAFGQWGDVMLEFMQPNNPDPFPSIIRDVLPEGATGPFLHHMAFITDDARERALAMQDKGITLALHCELESGIEAFILDTRDELGHMVELYAGTPTLREIYAAVKEASIGFDGTDPLRAGSV
ncbi:MAG: VOC family protein [Novosphingobium sp.]